MKSHLKNLTSLSLFCNCSYVLSSITKNALRIMHTGQCHGAYRHFQKYFSYIVTVSFIGGGNQSTRRKPPTCHKSLANFITLINVCIFIISWSYLQLAETWKHKCLFPFIYIFVIGLPFIYNICSLLFIFSFHCFIIILFIYSDCSIIVGRYADWIDHCNTCKCLIKLRPVNICVVCLVSCCRYYLYDNIQRLGVPSYQ